MRDYGGLAPKTTDDYIALQPLEFRATLERLRAIIKSVVPEANEVISYQIPCFRYFYMLVGIGANKKYCSFYVMNPALLKEMKKELKGVMVSGSTIHFAPGASLPVSLIKKIVRIRMKENKERAASNKK
jgi:uncharacterized protein YdhG (YjbR/CyaY superfamily)